MLAAMMWIDAHFYVPSYDSPLSTATFGADFSWLFGLVVGAVAYWLLSRGEVRRELATSAGDPADGRAALG
jgi:hypothetical protein